ncbi:MAG: rhomboid family intramembrane serine protease [Acidobacteriota bacterium]
MLPLRDLNPTRRLPVVNIALIVLNVVAFGYELSLGSQFGRFLSTFAFAPVRLFAPGASLGNALLTALISMFLHAGWAHIGGNMLFLWIFGDNVEDTLGHLRYVVFYFASGLAATLAHALSSPTSTLPAIGASGAISGVLGAYVFLYPRARIVTAFILFIFIRIVEVPAFVYLPLWFLLQLASGVATVNTAHASAGGTAWFAHIGGFVAGPLLLLLLRPRRR